MNYSEQDALAYQALLSANSSPHKAYWRTTCPFCPLTVGKVDKRWSLAIHAKSGFYSCWRCGTKGKIKEVPEYILDIAPDSDTKIETFSPPEGFFGLADDKSISLKPARIYLKKRGISKKTITEAKIGACIEGKFANRIIVPILATNGITWLGYSARDWTNQAKLRYRYPFGMDRQHMIYNHAAIHRETTEPVIAVEGVFDALPYWPDCVAFLGKPGDWQRDALLEAKRPICVVLDGDEHERGWALATDLAFAQKKAASIRLPPKTDPNDVDPEWLREEARRVIG